jgi:hypothetical protein
MSVGDRLVFARLVIGKVSVGRLVIEDEELVPLNIAETYG